MSLVDMIPSGGIPELALVEATKFDPQTAAALMQAFACRWPSGVRRSVVSDFACAENMPSAQFERMMAALIESGVVREDGPNLSLTVAASDAGRYAAVLRGVAYEQHIHHDLNSIEVTLSPPAHPSRLMQTLPKQDFSWAKLLDTKDNLFELASRAHRRFAILSPFFDEEGIAWMFQLFEASLPSHIERTLIVRGRDADELHLLRVNGARFRDLNVRVMSYAIAHDPDERSAVIETFHAKILVADNDHAYIGSANMNRASRDFSMECGVLISGPCVRPVAALVQAICTIATPIQLGAVTPA